MAKSINDLYQSVLGRAPDAAGVKYWQQQFGSTIEPAEVEAFKKAAAPEQKRVTAVNNFWSSRGVVNPPAYANPKPENPFGNSGGSFSASSYGGSSYGAAQSAQPQFDQLAFQRQLDEYRSSYDRQLEESRSSYARQLDEYRSSFNNQLETYRTQLNDASNLYKQTLDAKSQAEAEKEQYRMQSESYREQATAEQLRNLRSGSTVAGTPGSGIDQLASGMGGAGASRGNVTSSRSGNVITMVDATDSVLDKPNPVIASLSGGSTASQQAARSRAAAVSGGSAANYYSKRFG